MQAVEVLLLELELLELALLELLLELLELELLEALSLAEPVPEPLPQAATTAAALPERSQPIICRRC